MYIRNQDFVAMEGRISSRVPVFVVCILLSCSISVMSELLAMEESSVRSITSTGKRKVVEHAVLFQLKADTSGHAKEAIVQGLADLKQACPQWVVAESAGLVLQPNAAKGASVGLFMRLLFVQDLDDYFGSDQKTLMAKTYIMPFFTGEITIDYEAEVDDKDEVVFRQGNAFESGAERVIGIKVKNGTSQELINSMINAFSNLNGAPQLSSLLVQITAGTNFCARDQRYTHGVVVRCPSLEALQEFSKHPLYTDVIQNTVRPIAEKFLNADYIVDGSGVQKSSL